MYMKFFFQHQKSDFSFIVFFLTNLYFQAHILVVMQNPQWYAFQLLMSEVIYRLQCNRFEGAGLKLIAGIRNYINSHKSSCWVCRLADERKETYNLQRCTRWKFEQLLLWKYFFLNQGTQKAGQIWF